MKKNIVNFFKTNLIFLIILLLATLVRFCNFSDRITFGPEQAISLLVSSDYINEKFSLLGLPSTQRTTSIGHIIFYPPIFNYSLVPLLLAFNYDVTLITAFFALLNLATGALLYFLTSKILNKIIALFAASLFLLNDYMINHSLFIWSVNYLPILNLLILYLLTTTYLKKQKFLDSLFIGLLCSLSLGVEYIYLFVIVPIFIFLMYFSKRKLNTFLFFSLGSVLGVLPTIIFDLTHNFYHFKTLWQYLLDTINTPGQSKITYYHFLGFWPLLAIISGAFYHYIYKFSKVASVILLTPVITFNLTSSKVSYFSPTGMYPNLNLSKLEKTAEEIANDNPANFNLAMTFDFDSRAHPLRYLVKYNHGLTPDGVEDYPNSGVLYVLTTRDYPIWETTLWEISSFNATNIRKLSDIDQFALYKLTK